MDHIKKFEPLFGKWHAESFIGSGSFGRVYKIYCEEFGERFYSALKYISIPADEGEIAQLRTDGMDDGSISTYYSDIAKDIFSEITLMNKLRGNTNIVSFEDYQAVPKEGGIGYDIFIRMELLQSLTSRMLVSPVTRDETVKLGIDICSALELCKKSGIIHRDIKPDNIFISPYGDFKLGDFGIARQLEKTSTLMSKKGTYSYMAPEVYKEEKYGAPCDIYSLGLVMYRLLNRGRLPFLPEAPKHISAADRELSLKRRVSGEPLPAPSCADEELAAIVLKACAYEAKDRFASAEEMKKALLSYSRGEHVEIAAPAAAAPVPKEEAAAEATEAATGDRSGENSAEEVSTVGMYAVPAAAIAADKTHKAASEKAAGPNKKEAAPKAEPAKNAVTEAEKAKAEASKKSVSPKPEGEKKKKKLGLFIGIAAAALAAVIGLLAAVGVFGKKNSGAQEANVDVTGSAASVSAPADTEEAIITPAPTAEETTAVQTPEPSEELTAAPTLTPTPAPTPTPTPTPTPKPTATATAKPTATPTPRPTATPIPTVQFADPTFEAAFRDYYGINGPIYESDILEYSSLVLFGYRLNNIQDVAKFRNLTKLYLHGNNINNITPIEGLTNLTILSLGNNNISNIAVIAGLRNLTRLDLRNNSINNLTPLAGLKNLTSLNLEGNKIDNIATIANLTELTNLDLRNNNISDITPLAGLTHLSILILSGNTLLKDEQIAWLQQQLPNCTIYW